MDKFLGLLGEVLFSVWKRNKEVIIEFSTKIISLKTLYLMFFIFLISSVAGGFMYVFRDDIFNLKFKSEVQHVPQSIEQNLKEDLVVSFMQTYSKECEDQGYFLFYRIEVRGKNIFLQVKHIIKYVKNSDSFSVLSNDTKLKRFLVKKSKASEALNEILLKSEEGKIYNFDRNSIETLDGILDPFSSSFKMINSSYKGFKYIPILHDKLGLIILIGFLEVQHTHTHCSNSDVSVILEDLYRKYKKN